MAGFFLHIPLAIDSGSGGLTSFIVFVLWVCAQFIRYTKKDGPVTPSLPNPMANEFKEMFNQITGQQPRLSQTPKHVKPKKQQLTKTPSRPAPIIQPALVKPQDEPIHVMVIETAKAHSPTLSNFSASIKGIGFGVKSSFSLVGMSTSSSHHGKPHIPNFKNREQLKDAMLCQIILGPPKALENYS